MALSRHRNFSNIVKNVISCSYWDFWNDILMFCRLVFFSKIEILEICRALMQNALILNWLSFLGQIILFQQPFLLRACFYTLKLLVLDSAGVRDWLFLPHRLQILRTSLNIDRVFLFQLCKLFQWIFGVCYLISNIDRLPKSFGALRGGRRNRDLVQVQVWNPLQFLLFWRTGSSH